MSQIKTVTRKQVNAYVNGYNDAIELLDASVSLSKDLVSYYDLGYNHGMADAVKYRKLEKMVNVAVDDYAE